ncbi:hypothetical protein D5R93_04525 [Actinomyces lilanjuaniae]|uniref:Novel toxin 15 domain-containing protein n=1 Tax=Actinomyces lilanjuaniae TaxID=2321394 RepID=A0ABM6Z2J3_9ACTO|nr:hypothetical protein D5R93_04525 [Actinomyces lilanjuaniae]
MPVAPAVPAALVAPVPPRGRTPDGRALAGPAPQARAPHRPHHRRCWSRHPWRRGRWRPGPAPGHSSGGDGAALVASDMFTPGRAGGQAVLVWEGSVAAPDSPLAWHSAVPVEVFFHTGYQPATQELASEFTRQLDRQLSALSLLSAERLLEGIRTYRAQGRQPTSKATRDSRKNFMKEVVGDLRRVHRFSREDARAATREVDRALVVLHESDQVTFGPSQPATTAGGWPSLGHGAVNSSIGGQNKPMVAVLEQAALQVPRSSVPGCACWCAPSSPAPPTWLRTCDTGAPTWSRAPRPRGLPPAPGAAVDPQPRRRHHRRRPPTLAPTTRARARALGHDPAAPDGPAPCRPAAPDGCRPRSAVAAADPRGRLGQDRVPRGPGPARGTHRDRPRPHRQPARGLLPPPAHHRRTNATSTATAPGRPQAVPGGQAGPQDHPRGGPGRHQGPSRPNNPGAPHPTPDPHQKTPTQPRPGPLRPDPDLTR